MFARWRSNLITLKNILLNLRTTNCEYQLVTHNPVVARCLCSLVSNSASQIPLDLQIMNKNITRLIRSGRIQEARVLFDGLRLRNTVTWNSMMSGYVHRREIAKARKLFDEMPERDVVSWNLIISGYMGCRGSIYMQEAKYLFDQMPERDFVSWNTMISGYAKIGRIDEAMRLFMCMPKRNVVSWNAIISGLLQNGDMKRAVEFFERMPDRDAASFKCSTQTKITIH